MSFAIADEEPSLVSRPPASARVEWRADSFPTPGLPPAAASEPAPYRDDDTAQFAAASVVEEAVAEAQPRRAGPAGVGALATLTTAGLLPVGGVATVQGDRQARVPASNVEAGPQVAWLDRLDPGHSRLSAVGGTVGEDGDFLGEPTLVPLPPALVGAMITLGALVVARLRGRLW